MKENVILMFAFRVNNTRCIKWFTAFVVDLGQSCSIYEQIELNYYNGSYAATSLSYKQ